MPTSDLPSIPHDSDVLLDSNVLIYALQKKSKQCNALLGRCAKQDVCGYVTVESLLEVCNILMVAEAVSKGIIEYKNANLLKGKSQEIRGLQSYWNQTNRLHGLNLAIVDLDAERFVDAHPLRKKHGLMTMDSVILRAALTLGINHVATRNGDFDNVLDLIICKPTDCH